MSTQEKQEGDFKMKKPKAKQLGKVNEVVKVDLKQPEPEAPIKVDLTTPKQEVVEKKVEQEVVAKEEQPSYSRNNRGRSCARGFGGYSRTTTSSSRNKTNR
jgi:hypothetical protein